MGGDSERGLGEGGAEELSETMCTDNGCNSCIRVILALTSVSNESKILFLYYRHTVISEERVLQ